MIDRLEDYYTQNIRIDFTSAEQLAALNPDDIDYHNAAKTNRYVVSVLQGDVRESVYSTLLEEMFDTFDEAQRTFLRLINENPDAAYYDFVPKP